MVAKFEDPKRTTAPGAGASARVGTPVPTVPERRLGNADTLPPTPLKSLLAGDGASLYVLSADEILIDTVQRAAGEQFPVFGVARWQELEAAVAAAQCGIALLDADLLRDDIAARVAALNPYASRLVILVAAERTAAEGLMNMLSERKIHRLLIKPPALGITRLLVESAVNRWLRLREAAATELEPSSSNSAPPGAPHRPNARIPVPVLVVAAAALVVGVVAIAAVSAWRGAAPAARAPEVAVPAVEPAAAAVIEVPDRLAPLVAAAAAAFREGRLAAPPGDNALDHLLAVLAAEPAHVAAREQLALVVDALFAQAEAALLADDGDAAAAALASARRADPTSGRLVFLETQLARARAAAVAAAAEVARAVPPAPVTAPSTELASLLNIARTRLARGDLLEPAGDSAREYFERAAAIAPDDPAVVAVRVELASALAAAAQLTLATEDLAAVEVLVAEAWRFGADAEVLTLLDTELTAARAARAAEQRAAELALAERRLRSAELEFGARQERYLATATPASELSLLAGVAPVYPPEAQRRNIEGWVDLEFIVDTTGRPKALGVAAAEPPGRFEEAAMAAVGQYRYAPFLYEGRAYERRVRLRIRFALQ